MTRKNRNLQADPGHVTGKRLTKLIAEQEFRCALTNVVLEPEDAGLDHIVSIARGGTNTMDNVQIVHRIVNAMKGTLNQDEFVSWCRLVAAANPE